MSTNRIQELVEQGAADDEPDETPAPDEPTPTPEPEPQPEPPPMGAKELAAVGKSIDKENDRHEKRLRELYGAAFEAMRPCPLCLTEGFVPPAPPDGLAPEQVAAVHEALGEGEQVELPMLEGVIRCPKCDGWGHVATPSRNVENATKGCLNCSTRGYVEHFEQPAQPSPSATVYPIGNGAGTLPPVPGELDAWSRPTGHPHYGIAPALVQ
jgi:hypothetical protein